MYLQYLQDKVMKSAPDPGDGEEIGLETKLSDNPGEALALSGGEKVPVHRIDGASCSSPVWDRTMLIKKVGSDKLQLETLRDQVQNPCVSKGRFGWLDVSNIHHKIVNHYDDGDPG